jgi:hypothetical protein
MVKQLQNKSDAVIATQPPHTATHCAASTLTQPRVACSRTHNVGSASGVRMTMVLARSDTVSDARQDAAKRTNSRLRTTPPNGNGRTASSMTSAGAGAGAGAGAAVAGEDCEEVSSSPSVVAASDGLADGDGDGLVGAAATGTEAEAETEPLARPNASATACWTAVGGPSGGMAVGAAV